MYRMCPYHKINVNNPVWSQLSSVALPGPQPCFALRFHLFSLKFFRLSHAVSAQIKAFKVSCCLFIPFPKNGSVGRWVACVVDTLNLLYRRTVFCNIHLPFFFLSTLLIYVQHTYWEQETKNRQYRAAVSGQRHSTSKFPYVSLHVFPYFSEFTSVFATSVTADKRK